ncbi:unnamed protein product, partial [Oncorhynchus mykiss]
GHILPWLIHLDLHFLITLNKQDLGESWLLVERQGWSNMLMVLQSRWSIPIFLSLLPNEHDPNVSFDVLCYQVELLQSHHEAQRDALDQLSLKLNSQQYCTGTNRRTGREYTQMSKNNSLQEFESDFQELWDWLMDMDSVVTDSYKLMMSEEQQQYLYKGNSVEMSMWHPKKTHLLGWAESLRRSGAQLPPDFDERVNAMTQKWDQLQKILGESVGSTSPSQDPRSALSPHTSSLLGRLEGRIKDLKVWLRDTELFIFNSCLRQEAEQDLQASTQLQHFKVETEHTHTHTHTHTHVQSR